jgi:surface antigen
MKDAYRSVPGMCEGRRRRLPFLLLAALAPALGGCSFAIPSVVAGKEETTGSITRAPDLRDARLFADLGQEDSRRAKGALALALDPQGNGRPVRWDNPETGMRGQVAADGPPYVESNEICRAFTATLETATGKTAAVEGRACRTTPDDWPLKKLGPAR